MSSRRNSPRIASPRKRRGRTRAEVEQEEEIASEFEKTGRASRSRSPSPKSGQKSTSRSSSSSKERSNLRNAQPLSSKRRTFRHKELQEPSNNVEYFDLEDMETRSRRKGQQTPTLTPRSTSTPRSKRTSARTRPVLKQEEVEEEFNDTPKHLYGLDNSKGMTSGEEDVSVDTDTSSTCSPKKTFKQLRKFFNQKFRRIWNCKCIGVAMFAIFIAVAVVSALIRPFPYSDLPTVEVNQEQFQTDKGASWNSKSIQELQEKLDQLSAQVKTSLEMEKDSKRNLYNESITSEKHLAQYIETLVKDKMEAALDVYSADRLGIPDYALESAGGQIHGKHHSPTFNTGASRKLFGFAFWFDGIPPRVILQPDNTPGTCWAFQGQEGYVVVQLSQTVVPEMFTLEHIPASLSTDGDGKIANAPKDFSVWGWANSEGVNRHCLGKYTYDSQGKSLQSFNVKEPNNQEYTYIELRVESNHGHPTHTCIYRFRVHGKPAKANVPCNDP
ncbi:sperm-associated antigen 4 protein isoform X2 [Exaiptasia diaphana]|uniref:SUN domain-containing protein n=1 Tax=Exaiptasia diaphana TaxID=2652724 RepID=A0A913YJL5_EXADI|nr:sperm-associated antigen 4 protein isoform X2 [Exaiptasia diaphana]